MEGPPFLRAEGSGDDSLPGGIRMPNAGMAGNDKLIRKADTEDDLCVIIETELSV